MLARAEAGALHGTSVYTDDRAVNHFMQMSSWCRPSLIWRIIRLHKQMIHTLHNSTDVDASHVKSIVASWNADSTVEPLTGTLSQSSSAMPLFSSDNNITEEDKIIATYSTAADSTNMDRSTKAASAAPSVAAAGCDGQAAPSPTSKHGPAGPCSASSLSRDIRQFYDFKQVLGTWVSDAWFYKFSTIHS